MSLASVVRNAVAVADRVTKDLQIDVVHEVAGTPDGRGAVPYSAVSRRALYEPTARTLRLPDGTLVTSRGKLTFVGNVSVNAGDRFSAAGYDFGPVLETRGLADAGAGGQFLTEVWLG